MILPKRPCPALPGVPPGPFRLLLRNCPTVDWRWFGRPPLFDGAVVAALDWSDPVTLTLELLSLLLSIAASVRSDEGRLCKRPGKFICSVKNIL